MSLVAYGDSDDGSEDDECQDVSPAKIEEGAPNPLTEDKEESDQETEDTAAAPAVLGSDAPEDSQKLFAKLPPPRQNSTLHDPSLQDIIVKQADRSTKSKRALILIPSLNQFDDDEEEEEENKKKKLKPAQSGSGLIGMLPAPRHGSITSKQLTPQAVSRPSAPKPAPKRPPPKPQVSLTAVQKASNVWEEEDADDMETSEDAPKFFTFKEPPLPKVSLDVEPAQASGISGLASSTSAVPVASCPAHTEPHFEPQQSASTVPDVPLRVDPEQSRKGKIVYAEPDEPGTTVFDVELDDGALVRLRGKRQEEINIIDVCADNHIDKSQILIRGLTEQPTYSAHSDTSDFNTSQQHRRKHQITYLAQQAKAREQDLKNTWAQNRMTRRQTQAKYGF